MNDLKRRHLARRLVTLCGADRLRLLDARQGWPSTCEIRDGAEWREAELYLGVIGETGRRNADELRIQNPADGDPIRFSSTRSLLLIGLWTPAEGASVVVAWNAVRRVGRATRFSIFVPLTTVLAAQRNGRATHESASGEHITAYASSSTDWVATILREADTRRTRVFRVQEEPMNTDLDDVPEGESDLESLAEKLATLSQGEAPTKFRARSPFEANEVDWATNAWIHSLAEVQEWLNLDGTLEPAAGAAETLETLFSMLGVSASRECFGIEEGHARLTDIGIGHLDVRLDTAIGYKITFSESLDEGSSLGEATRAWDDAWEDTVVVGPEAARTAVHAKVDTWQIYMFKDRAKVDGLELNPSYQRGVVWSDKESCELIDSVLRGIPLPSIILNQRAGDETLEIVDGKQRLTAILRFIGGHPDALKFVKRMEEEAGVDATLFDTNYRKWRAAVKKQRGLTTEDERFLPFAYRLPKVSGDKDPLQPLAGKYYCDMKEDIVQIEGRGETVRRLFELPMTSYKLSVILYSDTDIHQIHKVFGLYNRQGKKLNATEVRNAIYHHLHLTKLLLLLSGDSSDSNTLAPYLEAGHLDLRAIPDMLEAMNVAGGRFNRTKITSWVAAFMLHRLENKASNPICPGSTSLIEGLMLAVADKKPHPMRNEKACEQFAKDLQKGATLLQDLRNMNAFAAGFTGDKHGVKWEDLPAVTAWLACTLAAMTGISANETVKAAVAEATRRTERLTKQQARSQWGFIARVTFELLQAMSVNLDELGPLLEKRFGHSCLTVLEARREQPRS